ncbi:hypothetical protein [Gimibacter soli]|uniref:Uncharacterized protein n=1 Tax=Gimibacter soli TaxID=3024400 RepID=A0AAE9XS06_9PROT|nr:hypothetical protein [Gimibacter soli]WCL52910.1 hypothetical protein PH603_10205 [Gimibacter soli]
MADAVGSPFRIAELGCEFAYMDKCHLFRTWGLSAKGHLHKCAGLPYTPHLIAVAGAAFALRGGVRRRYDGSHPA